MSLGGVQIASIVVGAVLVLAVVFYLGLEAGQRIGTRRAEAARPASLGDLDAAASQPRPPAGKDLTFPTELPKAKPPAQPPPPRKPEPGADAGEAAPAAALPTETPPPDDAPPTTAPRGGWTVQLGASQRREEAEALARKVQALGPRIEEADIPGKGHFFRVRVGRFESKEQAERYKADVVRETGISGMVVPPG